MVEPTEIADPLSENPEIQIIENPIFNKLPNIPDIAKSLAPMMPMLSSLLPHFNFPTSLTTQPGTSAGSIFPFPLKVPKLEGFDGINGLNGLTGNALQLPMPPFLPSNQGELSFVKQETVSPQTHQKPRKPRQYKRKDKSEKEKRSGKVVKPEYIVPTGPPFQLDYAPHLRCNGFRLETSTTSPEVICLDDDPPTNRLPIAPSMETLEKHKAVDLIQLLGRPAPPSPIPPKEKPSMLAPNPFGLGNLNMDFSKISGFDGKGVLENANQLKSIQDLKDQIGLMQASQNLNAANNQFHGNILSAGPPSMPALHLLPPDLLKSLHLPENANNRPISAPLSPNQKVYQKMQAAFPEWRINYLKKRANTIHTNALFYHRINTLRRPNGMSFQYKSIENEFRNEKAKIFNKLSPKETEEFCVMFLKNCASHEVMLNKKQKEFEEEGDFIEWMKSQIDPTPAKPYVDTVLPTFAQIVEMIKEAFMFLNMCDCDENQRHQLTSAIQFDWSDPGINPQRILTFSTNIKLPATRIYDIMREARENMRGLIWTKNYYMSIDQDVPDMEY